MQEFFVPPRPGIGVEFEVGNRAERDHDGSDESDRAPAVPAKQPQADCDDDAEGEEHRSVHEASESRGGLRGGFFGDLQSAVGGHAASDGTHEVVDHEQVAQQVEAAAEGAQVVHRDDILERLDERVGGSRAVGRQFVEREALADAGDPHRGDVEEDADHPDPEVEVGQAFAVELSTPESRDEPVEHARGHEAVPSEGPGVDVTDDPVGVVAEGVDGLDREQRAFEGRHAVEGHRGGHEFDHRVGA